MAGDADAHVRFFATIGLSGRVDAGHRGARLRLRLHPKCYGCRKHHDEDDERGEPASAKTKSGIENHA